ncbi:MAG TPA: MMPL family transporter [Polyangiaceae bacterium]|nr:MMPL family transporter [Polyangiaceae bacterium]
MQVRRPWAFVVVAALLAIPSLHFARQLVLKTGFDSLLPDNKPSVIEQKRVAKRTAGVANLAIVIGGKNEAAMKRFSDALLDPLRALGPDWVGTAENGVRAEQEFLKERQALYLPLAKVQDIHDRVEESFGAEVYGNVVDDPDVKPLTRESVIGEIDAEKAKTTKGGPPYPDGYYMNAERTELVVMVRTPIAQGDLGRTKELERRVNSVIDRVDPKRFDPSLTTGLTGDVVTTAEVYGSVKGDLVEVGVVGVSMILVADFLFFLRLRAVITMALAIGTGLLWTFAITRFSIGQLNTASGFLVSIIFGNGLNFGVLLRARYGEARRADESTAEALKSSLRDTFKPTLAVAAAAGAGYMSLASTNFRGFRDFGWIGGYGMLLCWAANYLLMPPLLVLFERLAPIDLHAVKPGFRGWFKRLADHGVPFGAPFAWVARHGSPKLVALLGVLLGLGGAAAIVRYVESDPLEYNLGKLENDSSSVQSAAMILGRGLTNITGRTGQDGMAIMTDRIDQVKPLLAELERRRLAGGKEPPFDRTASIFDLIPDDQEQKLALLNETRTRLEGIRRRGKLSDEDWDAIAPYLPPKDLKPFGIAELPERVARPFTERDGTRGRIVYIAPAEGQSVRNLHYLLKWANAYRAVELPTGEVIHGSGRAVIFADMLSGVTEESPKAILLAAIMTALVVVFTFMRSKDGWLSISLVLGALCMGLAWMGGILWYTQTKINFLNFIAIPITLGVGVDYSINMVHRWHIEGAGKLPKIVRETGGAIVLCSLTTILGYTALMHSVNSAVRSFGRVAVLGELTCIASVMIVLPAILRLLESRHRAPST